MASGSKPDPTVYAFSSWGGDFGLNLEFKNCLGFDIRISYPNITLSISLVCESDGHRDQRGFSMVFNRPMFCIGDADIVNFANVLLYEDSHLLQNNRGVLSRWQTCLWPQ